MKFSKLYEDVKASDLFKPASPEEVGKRKEQYSAMKLEEIVSNLKKTKWPDGTWHVHEDLGIGGYNIASLKPLNISIIDGRLVCSSNILKNLEGAPTTVNGNFYCSFNYLTTLQGAPNTVNGNFYCNNNHLTNLDGAPKTVSVDFICFNNDKKFTEDEVRAVCDVKGGIEV